MFLSEHIQTKWQPVLDHPDLPEVKDNYKRAVTSVILENQEKALREDEAFLSEAAPANATGSSVTNWNPILISLVRRAMPNLIAYDVCGVQPMSGPTGLIFAMRSRYATQGGTEALFNEADSDFTGRNAAGSATGGFSATAQAGTNPAILNDGSPGTYTTGTAMTTAKAEALGDASGNAFAEMAFSIEKSTVTAKSRALKAEYTMELAQDLKAIHGLDAETELSNILSAEILAEINREVVRSIYIGAEFGQADNDNSDAAINTTNAGIFDLDTDSNGRWSVERFKGLMFALERDANTIAQRTRRGKGNVIICSSDVASALQMAGVLDYQSSLSNSLNVDDTGNTFVGVLNGKFKVYIDPYSANLGGNASPTKQFYVVGFKGSSPYDAGIFYCPYVPLQMVRAVGQDSFQPKIGFKTRYGLVANPFAGSDVTGTGAITADGLTAANSNRYYRRVQVANIM
ncbi:MAG TPA: ATP-binding protein [Flavobacteriaceae bacterium]|nr:ATP-binding protein [Flavobacteriaceae bacterium]